MFLAPGGGGGILRCKFIVLGRSTFLVCVVSEPQSLQVGREIILHDDKVESKSESFSFPKNGTRMAKEKSVRTPGALSLFGILTSIVWPIIPM